MDSEVACVQSQTIIMLENTQNNLFFTGSKSSRCVVLLERAGSRFARPSLRCASIKVRIRLLIANSGSGAIDWNYLFSALNAAALIRIPLNLCCAFTLRD